MNYYLVYLAQLKYVLIKWYNDSWYYFTINNIYKPNELFTYLFAIYGVISLLNQFRTKKISIELNLNDSMNEIRLRKRRRICYVDLDKEE
jgi:hypothetical protein